MPPSLICGTTNLTVETGTAKPTPAFAPLPVLICELTPITRPLPSSSGPPELPGLIAASVCTALAIGKPFGASIVRPSEDTMPVVTLPSSPNGEPIAIAWSPGSSARRVAELERLQAALDGARVDLEHGEVGSTGPCPSAARGSASSRRRCAR